MEPTSKKLSKRRFTRRIWTHCSRLQTCASSTTTRSACRPHPGCRCSVWWTPGFSCKLKSWPSCRRESTGDDVAQRGRQKFRETSSPVDSLRQLGHDFNLHEKPGVHKTLHLHPGCGRQALLVVVLEAQVRSLEQCVHIRRVNRLFDNFFEVGSMRCQGTAYI